MIASCPLAPAFFNTYSTFFCSRQRSKPWYQRRTRSLHHLPAACSSSSLDRCKYQQPTPFPVLHFSMPHLRRRKSRGCAINLLIQLIQKLALQHTRSTGTSTQTSEQQQRVWLHSSSRQHRGTGSAQACGT